MISVNNFSLRKYCKPNYRSIWFNNIYIDINSYEVNKIGVKMFPKTNTIKFLVTVFFEYIKKGLIVDKEKLTKCR